MPSHSSLQQGQSHEYQQNGSAQSSISSNEDSLAEDDPEMGIPLTRFPLVSETNLGELEITDESIKQNIALSTSANSTNDFDPKAPQLLLAADRLSLNSNKSLSKEKKSKRLSRTEKMKSQFTDDLEQNDFNTGSSKESLVKENGNDSKIRSGRRRSSSSTSTSRDSTNQHAGSPTSSTEPIEQNAPQPPNGEKKKKKKKPKIFLGGANPLSQFLFLWVIDLLNRCRKIADFRNLNFQLRPTDNAKNMGDLLEACWKEEINQDKRPPSLLRALFKAFGKVYAPLALWKVGWAGCTWFGAFWLLRWIIEYQEALVTPTPMPNYHGHILALGLFLCCVGGSLCFHQLTVQCTRIGIQCRAALMVLIYRKSLRLSFVKGGVGDIVNLTSNECNRIAEASVNGHYFWAAFFESVVLLVFAITDVGKGAIPVIFLVLFVLLPLQYWLAKNASVLSYKNTNLITKRVHLMSEVLTAIKLIKFYAWEDYYRTKIGSLRHIEIEEMRKQLITKISSSALVFVAPVTCTLVGLGTYQALGGPITASVTFTLISLFNTLRYPLLLLPNAERAIAGAQASLKRLEDFFLLPEVDIPDYSDDPVDTDVLMRIKDADFVWDGDLDHPHLYELNLELKRNTVIGVVGDMGSGKSLLAAIMGQIKKTRGTLKSYGHKFGYVPQEPWLISATLRDNILFGTDIDEKKYSDAIRISGLTRDFMLLSNGDLSLVNELTLSASQKQRLSLARCIYHNPDIILMEDCLSDFDHSSAKRLFKETLKNQISKGRCVVILTQQKAFLAECDSILVLRNGRIVEQGTYSELKKKNVNFSAWVTDMVVMDDDPNGVLDKVNEIKLDPSGSAVNKFLSPLRPPGAASVLQQANDHADVAMGKPPTAPGLGGPFAALRAPRVSRGSSPLASAEVITAERTISASDVGQDTLRHLMELNKDSAQNAQLNEHTISKMIERNQASLLTGNATRPPANFSNQDIVTRTIQANQLTVHSLHDFDVATMEPAILDPNAQKPFWLPYRQFLSETTSLLVGSILISTYFFVHAIRFFSDTWLAFYVDRKFNIPDHIYIGIYTGLCLAVAIFVFGRGIGFVTLILKKSVSLHSRILEAILCAPMSFYDITPLGHILSHFAKHQFLIDEFLPDALLQVLSFLPLVLGVIIIVCATVPWVWATLPLYGLLIWLIIPICIEVQDKFQQLESSNKSPMFAHLSTTLEGLFSIRLYKVQERFDAFNRNLIDADHKALYPALVVKTFTALILDLVCSLFIYITAEFSILFLSSSPSYTGLAVSNALQLLLFVQWLMKMMIELHASLSSVSAVIYFGEHVPRESKGQNRKLVTPSPEWPKNGEIEFKNITLRYQRYGVDVLKSVSFHIEPKEKIAIVGRSGSGKTTLLMSLLRIVEPVEGKILLDGQDISQVSLKDVRSNIAVIPQEPVMLTGTIRTNLDPMNTCTDEEIWKALRAVHLGEKIQEMPAKLDTPIIENGKIFSLSERQLFCIARAIIIRSSIVVLDDPANTVDKDTEHLISQVIKENFSECTVLVLATRFRVIVQMDRVMVMDHGRVVEFDTPLALLEKPKSKLSLMLAQMGDLEPEKLKALARAHMDVKYRTSGASSLQSSMESLHHYNGGRLSLPRPSGVPKSLEDIFATGPGVPMTKSVSVDPNRKSYAELRRLNGRLNGYGPPMGSLVTPRASSSSLSSQTGISLSKSSSIAAAGDSQGLTPIKTETLGGSGFTSPSETSPPPTYPLGMIIDSGTTSVDRNQPKSAPVIIMSPANETPVLSSTSPTSPLPSESHTPSPVSPKDVSTVTPAQSSPTTSDCNQDELNRSS